MHTVQEMHGKHFLIETISVYLPVPETFVFI